MLRQLVDGGWLTQVPHEADRRQRLLYPTQKGRDLSIELTHIQSRRIKAAIEDMAGGDRETVRTFLFNMIERDERALVEDLTAQDR